MNSDLKLEDLKINGIEEVRLDDLYKRDNQERFLVYELSYY